jgi:hypothetical protein
MIWVKAGQRAGGYVMHIEGSRYWCCCVEVQCMELRQAGELRLKEPGPLIQEHFFVLAMFAELVQGILATSRDPMQCLLGEQSCCRLGMTPGTGSSTLLLGSPQSSHTPAHHPALARQKEPQRCTLRSAHWKKVVGCGPK